MQLKTPGPLGRVVLVLVGLACLPLIVLFAFTIMSMQSQVPESRWLSATSVAFSGMLLFVVSLAAYGLVCLMTSRTLTAGQKIGWAVALVCAPCISLPFLAITSLWKYVQIRRDGGADPVEEAHRLGQE